VQVPPEQRDRQEAVTDLRGEECEGENDEQEEHQELPKDGQEAADRKPKVQPQPDLEPQEPDEPRGMGRREREDPDREEVQDLEARIDHPW